MKKHRALPPVVKSRRPELKLKSRQPEIQNLFDKLWRENLALRKKVYVASIEQRERMNRWKRQNPEKVRASSKKDSVLYRIRHREKYNAIHAASMQKWRERNPERAKFLMRKSSRAWYQKLKANPQRYAAFLERRKRYMRARARR